LLVGTALALGPFIASAHAEPAAGITPGNVLILFDTSTPAVVASRVITGLGPNETVRGIDVRPATGLVFLTTVTTGSAANSYIRTYTVNTNTGAAAPVGVTAAALPFAADVPTGFDFSPFVDLIRLVNTNDENARIDPNTGTLAGDDVNITPAPSSDLIAAAYDRNRPGDAASALYVIDRFDGALGVMASPNNGVVTDLGSLGFSLNQANDGGFDTSPSGTAFAALTNAADNLTRLYTVNIGTGAATLIGQIGNGTIEVRSITILDDDRDSDGRLTSADNCPSAANADQANLDGDASGDACDDDDDGDGIPDVVEALIGTNPRSADTDGDGKSDSVDRCPTIAAATADGCPVVAGPFTCGITGFPSRIPLRTLRSRGVSLTLRPNQAASFVVELRGKARGFRLASVGDVVLAERRLPRSASPRKVRLTIRRSHRAGLRRKAKLQLRVSATDAFGRTFVLTRRLTIR
jgi:hypothetical protein